MSRLYAGSEFRYHPRDDVFSWAFILDAPIDRVILFSPRICQMKMFDVVEFVKDVRREKVKTGWKGVIMEFTMFNGLWVWVELDERYCGDGDPVVRVKHTSFKVIE